MMTPERFENLAGIYGTELRRWPDEERDAAHDLMARNPAAAEAGLAFSRELDRLLDGYRIAAPGAALQDAILAAAPSLRPLWRRATFWWQGAGIAGMGLTGMAVGALLVAMVIPFDGSSDDGDGVFVVTAFGDFEQVVDEQ